MSDVDSVYRLRLFPGLDAAPIAPPMFYPETPDALLRTLSLEGTAPRPAPAPAPPTLRHSALSRTSTLQAPSASATADDFYLDLQTDGGVFRSSRSNRRAADEEWWVSFGIADFNLLFLQPCSYVSLLLFLFTPPSPFVSPNSNVGSRRPCCYHCCGSIKRRRCV